MPLKRKRFLLLYGSQTGQADAITEEILDNSAAHGLECERHCLSQAEKKFTLEKETCVVIVTSTTGDGEPPETALKFFRRLKKKTHSSDYLSHLNYALLGLGDSNYTNFCNAGKTLDKRLEELGAKRFYLSGWADDAVGLEQVVEPWIEGLFPALLKFLSFNCPDLSGTSQITEICEIEVERSHFDKDGESSDKKIETKITESNGHFKEKESQAKNTTDSTEPNSDKFESESSSTISNGKGLNETEDLVKHIEAAYLSINFDIDQDMKPSLLPSNSSAVTTISEATVIRTDILTSKEALKKTLRLRLKIGEEFEYQPGDSVSVYCQNEEKEVEMLLKRLNVLDKADIICQIELMKDTKKAKAPIPLHIPTITTLRTLFTYNIDIREPPKKAVIRQLVEGTTNPQEKRRLQELCSKQGMGDYTSFIRNPEISILDLLLAFPSCNPDVDRLIESLPKLQPRPYSACSSPLKTPQHLDIAFNVINIPEGDGRSFARQGVCTGMLDRVTNQNQIREETTEDGTNTEIFQLQISARPNQYFRLPSDVSIPLILIGPGTGVAPFVGFLQHREMQKNSAEFADQAFGEIFLFFGCRNRSQDFLFKEELMRLQKVDILSKLYVSFSREAISQEDPKYVQDNIKSNAEQVLQLIYNQKAVIYVCGDAKNMAKDVNQTFMKILQEKKEMTESEAKSFITKMRLERRYLEDVWT
uniref:Methionine synthase reductase n=2 Tax=Magallana gigas TaxID=29159 RepID=A0A8W8HR45_MAGGI